MPPPVSRTGVETPHGVIGRTCGEPLLGLGRLQGTTRTADRALLTARLAILFGPAKERASGLQWYREATAFGESGVVLGAVPRSASSLSTELFVMFPQTPLDALGLSGALALLGEMVEEYGLRPSRLDLYLDDRDRLVDPLEVLRAIETRQTRTHMRAWHSVKDHKGGMTTYLGTRQGEAMLRVYRKWAESGNPEDGVRWETEYRGERAQLVGEMLRPLVSSVAVGALYLGLLRAMVDFVDTSTGSRPERAPLLDWWSALVGSVGRVRPVLAKVRDSLARRKEWTRRQVAPTLALLFAVGGSDAISALIQQGWDRAPWHLTAPPPRWVPVEVLG